MTAPAAGRAASDSSVMLLCRSERLAAVDRRILRDIGIEPAWSLTSGEEAARMLAAIASVRAAGLPDVVICHQELEDMEGDAFCSLIRLHPRLMALPVLLLTGNDDEAQQLLALGCGAAALLARPYSQDDMRETLVALTILSRRKAALFQGERAAAAHDFDAALNAYTPLLRPERAAEDYFRAGMRCLEKEQWRPAITLFQRALQAEQLRAEAELGVAAAYRGRGDAGRSQAWLARAAESFARARRWDRARSAYIRLRQDHPHAKNPVLAEAQRLLREGDPEGAADALAAVHDLTPPEVIGEKMSQACLSAHIRHDDAGETQELLDRLSGSLEGRLGPGAGGLDAEIRTRLDSLIAEREERIRRAAEQRRREILAEEQWRRSRAAAAAEDDGGDNGDVIDLIPAGDAARDGDAAGDVAEAPKKSPRPPRKKEPDPPPLPEYPPPPLPEEMEDAEPAIPLLEEEDVTYDTPVLGDVLSVITCTWRLARKKDR